MYKYDSLSLLNQLILESYHPVCTDLCLLRNKSDPFIII